MIPYNGNNTFDNQSHDHHDSQGNVHHLQSFNTTAPSIQSSWSLLLATPSDGISQRECWLAADGSWSRSWIMVVHNVLMLDLVIFVMVEISGSADVSRWSKHAFVFVFDFVFDLIVRPPSSTSIPTRSTLQPSPRWWLFSIFRNMMTYVRKWWTWWS